MSYVVVEVKGGTSKKNDSETNEGIPGKERPPVHLLQQVL